MNAKEKQLVILSVAGSLSMVILLVFSIVNKAPKVQAAEQIELPYLIPGTQLVLEQLTGYEGPYLEDGSGEEVVDVAAVVIRNTGKKDLAGFKLYLSLEDGALSFTGYDIPAGALVTVLEENRRTYTEGSPVACWINAWPSRRLDRLQTVLCREISVDSVLLTNCSGTLLEGLEICYKNYLPELEGYMGGITHRLSIAPIPPGGSIEVYLPNYLSGYSSIVRIE